jgi:hypothetical protein
MEQAEAPAAGEAFGVEFRGGAVAGEDRLGAWCDE